MSSLTFVDDVCWKTFSACLFIFSTRSSCDFIAFDFICDNNDNFRGSWVKVQNFPNPELKKFKFLNLLDAYKNE